MGVNHLASTVATHLELDGQIDIDIHRFGVAILLLHLLEERFRILLSE
ncbi:hypothetical protein HRbin14_01298 [bacterium HR14]|nr:hypothetical protein HRbin14_01298 [bacterium HR14]